MRKNYVIAMIIFSVVIMFIGGCTDRGNKLPTENDADNWGVIPDQDWAFRTSTGSAFTIESGTANTSPQLLFQLHNPDALLKVEVFLPEEAVVEDIRVPLLVLLAPENENEYFFRDRGLYEIATTMIANNEIQPMMIVTIGNDPTFGGYFYGNSFAAGMYDAIIADTTNTYDSDFGRSMSRGLLAKIENDYGRYLFDSPNKRGIGGVGQGSYGAFRAILKHPGIYNSISVSDGPLSFEDGLDDLFLETIAEQIARCDADPNLTGFADIKLFDTLSTTPMPLSHMFIGGAIAFSPNDTAVNYTFSEAIRDTVADQVTLTARYLWTDSTNTDTSATLVTELIKQADLNWDFHLPFEIEVDTTPFIASIDTTIDTSATPDTNIISITYDTAYVVENVLKNDAIWQRWMDNDLSILLRDVATPGLDDVKIWIGTTSQAKWNYGEMTQAWITTLGSNVDEVYEYNGYSGSDQELSNEFVYDLMKKMLKFHSDSFGTD